MSVPTDLELARAVKLQPISSIIEKLGIDIDDTEAYGKYKAKIHLKTIEKLKKNNTPGKYIVVTAMTPTPLGEGKTVTTVGLTQGLGYVGKNAALCIRQPSLGPTFGIKGGAAGGGYSQVLPMEDINLHLTGDMHAITAAHNLIAAALDAHIFHEQRNKDKILQRGIAPLNINPQDVKWRRVVDINDRALRHMVIGLGGTPHGIPRESGFDITAASEIMAILALSTSFEDLRTRIDEIILAYTYNGEPVRVKDIDAGGAASVLLKDAIFPNLLQTMEGQPAFIHAGPFANIAHGNSSIVADYMALNSADYVVTEAGFGSDIGFEKFMNIKCRTSGLYPDAAVVVCTVRALKMHGGGPKVIPGKPLDNVYNDENLELVEKGMSNLYRHIENVKKFGVPAVIVINRFHTDSENEIKLIKKLAKTAGAFDVVEGNYWAKGGEGAADLANAVVKACQLPKQGEKFTYSLDISLEDKMRTVAIEVYGAEDVDFAPRAQEQIDAYKKMGYNDLPVCMAKTQYSFSHDPLKKGAPNGFVIPIREVRLSAGAKFIYPLIGNINTMPGLGIVPAYKSVYLDPESHEVMGLF